jgi:hypothetical protein
MAVRDWVLQPIGVIVALAIVAAPFWAILTLLNRRKPKWLLSYRAWIRAAPPLQLFTATFATNFVGYSLLFGMLAMVARLGVLRILDAECLEFLIPRRFWEVSPLVYSLFMSGSVLLLREKPVADDWLLWDLKAQKRESTSTGDES